MYPIDLSVLDEASCKTIHVLEDASRDYIFLPKFSCMLSLIFICYIICDKLIVPNMNALELIIPIF